MFVFVITVQLPWLLQSSYEDGDPPIIVTIERNINPSDDEAFPVVQQSVIVATVDSENNYIFIQLVPNFRFCSAD